MKIIDWIRRGNVVRLLLAPDALDDWDGDDWDDAPYEHNAGEAYGRYVTHAQDVAVPLDMEVMEPADDWRHGDNSPWSKDDMKERRIPMLIVAPADPWLGGDWGRLLGRDDTVRVYMGDPPERLTSLPGVHAWPMREREP